jgi:hypothetical protein
MTDETWQRSVLEALERLVGPEQAAEVEAQWDTHASRDTVEVTFLGPYSSGKSSLLRRLIVDDGSAVPDWLTVSARRETFELNAVDVGDLTFTDAPGFASGSEFHDELAQDALALSDAFLLVVPPNLLTTDRELVGSILSGRYFFGEPRPGCDRALLAVIAQADSMSIDPDDDVDAMHQLADRKRNELILQLEAAAGMPLSELQVLCVAADPYEEQARQSQPQRSAFDTYRDWDGIDALTAALATLPARHAELRRAAGVRYFCLVAVGIASEARAIADELQASAEELRARQTEWNQHKAHVDAVVEAAKVNLQTDLVALANTLSEEFGLDQRESRSLFEDRWAATIDQWLHRWNSELDLVLGEAKVQVDERLERPRARRTEEFLRSLTVGATTIDVPPTNSRIVNLLNDSREHLQVIARRTFELRAGRQLGSFIDKGPRAASSADAKAAGDQAVRSAVRLEASLRIADAVLDIVTIIDTERRQQKLDELQRRQREHNRDRIEKDASIVSAEIVEGTGGHPGWRARADAALVTLRARLGLPDNDNASDDLLQTVAAQHQLISELEGLVASGPVHSTEVD